MDCQQLAHCSLWGGRHGNHKKHNQHNDGLKHDHYLSGTAKRGEALADGRFCAKSAIRASAGTGVARLNGE